jgi:hypothetical protein
VYVHLKKPLHQLRIALERSFYLQILNFICAILTEWEARQQLFCAVSKE